MYCRKCGSELSDGMQFCTQCGQPVKQAAPEMMTATAAAHARSVPGQAAQDAPRNTAELFKYIAKKIPGKLLKALPATIIIGVVSWLVHTYLLVKVNEGFNPDTWLAQNFLNVKGGFISSTILWAMLGGVITMFISSLIRGVNPFKSLADMVRVPGNIIRKNREMKNALLPVLLIACSVTLLVEKLFSGIAGIVAGGILLSSVAAFAGGRGGILTMILRMIFSDIQVYILKKKQIRMDNDAVYMTLGASGLVFLLYGFLMTTNILGLGRIPFLGIVLYYILAYAWVILAILGIVLYVRVRNAPKAMIFFALFVASLMAAQRIAGVRILADDGGWAEAGGTFIGWISSSGALQAILRGLPPAIAGIIGSYISSILSGISGGLGGIGVTDTSSAEPGDGSEVPSGGITTVDPDGTITTKYPDGSKTVKERATFAAGVPGYDDPDNPPYVTTHTDSNGRVTTEYPDGAKTVKERAAFAAGVPGYDDPDNLPYVTTHTDRYGTETTDYPDGAKTVRVPQSFAAGEPGYEDPTKPVYVTTHTDRNGVITTEYPDGHREIRKPDGTTTTENPRAFEA